MDKKYLAQIIATDNEGLQMISACSAGAKVKVSDIKYLASNKVFLLSIQRTKIEQGQNNKTIILLKTPPAINFHSMFFINALRILLGIEAPALLKKQRKPHLRVDVAIGDFWLIRESLD